MQKTFSISEALNYGWETFKQRPFFWVVVSLLGGSSSFSLNYNSAGTEDFSFPFLNNISLYTVILFSMLFFIIVVAVSIIFIILQMGAYKAALMQINGKNPEWKTLVSQKTPIRVVKFMLVQLFYGLLVIFGLILFIIPGIYFALKYIYAPFIFVDKNTSISDSFKQSAEATKGVKLRLLLFGFTCIGLLLLGLLAFIVGIFIAIPVAFLANFYIYKKLST